MGKTRKPQGVGHGAQAGHGGLCGAKTRSGGKCGRSKGWGTGHPGVGRCKSHGGSTPNHELAGALELAGVMGAPVDIQPHEAILECVRRVWGEVHYCDARIRELRAEDAAGPVQSRKLRPLSLGKDGEDPDVPVEEVTAGPPALHIWIETRHRLYDRAVNYSKIALAAGVEERRVRVAERAGEMMAELIRGVLTDLGIPLGDPKTREVVTRHLALIEGGAGA